MKARRIQYHIHMNLCVGVHFIELMTTMLKMRKKFQLKEHTLWQEEQTDLPWIPVVVHARNSFSHLLGRNDNGDLEKQMRPLALAGAY